MRPAFIHDRHSYNICQYQQPKVQENDYTNLTTDSFIELFSYMYPHSSKKQAYRQLECVSTRFYLVDNWPGSFKLLTVSATPTAGIQHLFETWRLLTSEPGFRT